MLKEICKFIQADDRNSDIMDCYEEYRAGTMPEETLREICRNVLSAAREDYEVSGQLLGRIKEYYAFLGI